MFLNIHSLMSIMIILVYHTVQWFLLSFDALGNKEAINALNKIIHVISYNNIYMQNGVLSRIVLEDRLHFPYLPKARSTIDNNDGRQETLTGSDTTSDTSKTFFRILPVIGEQRRPLLLKD